MIAGALALCVAGAQVAAIAHFAFVRHGTCPEHGLVVHASVHRSHSLLTETGAGALAQADAEEGGDHAHDHCLVASLRRDGAGNLDERRQSLVRTLGEPLAPAPVDAPAAAAGVWRVAPKQSPPAA